MLSHTLHKQLLSISTYDGFLLGHPASIVSLAHMIVFPLSVSSPEYSGVKEKHCQQCRLQMQDKSQHVLMLTSSSCYASASSQAVETGSGIVSD